MSGGADLEAGLLQVEAHDLAERDVVLRNEHSTFTHDQITPVQGSPRSMRTKPTPRYRLSAAMPEKFVQSEKSRHFSDTEASNSVQA
jgi:hypothetical protein